MSESNKWNRSRKSSDRSVGVRSGSRTHIRALVAALIIVAGGGLAIWLMLGEKREEKSSKAKVIKPSSIAEAKPQIPTKAPGEAKPTEKPVPYWELDESHTNGFSETQLRKWRNVRRPRMKPFTRERPKAKYEIFDYRSENMIACLLTAKPGAGFIGTPNYMGIDEDFLKSCTSPIIVTKDDDEYSAKLKRQMIEVKIDIKARMDAGEKLADILQSARKEMQQLASYRQFLAEEIRKVEISGENVEKVKDFIDAANKMLAKRGIAPLSPGPITMNRLKHMKKEGTTE